MATALRFKVYSPRRELIASVRDVEQALILAARAGHGSKIKHMEWGALWTEGQESPCLMNQHEAGARIAKRIEEKKAVLREQYEKTFGKAKS